MMRLEERLKLNQGETIHFVKKYKTRYNGLTSRSFYNIVNRQGKKVGSVVYKEENDHNGTGVTYFSLKKFDLNDHLVFKTKWGYSVFQPDYPSATREHGVKKLKNGLHPELAQKL